MCGKGEGLASYMNAIYMQHIRTVKSCLGVGKGCRFGEEVEEGLQRKFPSTPEEPYFCF